MYSFFVCSLLKEFRLKYEQLYFLTEQQMSHSLTTTKVFFSFIHWYSIQSEKKEK